MKENLILNDELLIKSQEDYDVIQVAIERLSSASQEQFESIKKEKWYNRLFDMVTFSQKGKKRLAEQIGTLAQAQQIFIELLLRLSANDSKISSMVIESMQNILKLQQQDEYLLKRIKQLENVSLGIKADMDIKKLSEKEQQALSAMIYKISNKTDKPSDNQQRFANSVLNSLSVNVSTNNTVKLIESIDSTIAKRNILTCCMEYMFLKDCSDDEYCKFTETIDEFGFNDKVINSIKKQILELHKCRGTDGFISKYIDENYIEIEPIFESDFLHSCEEDIVVELTDENIDSFLCIPSSEKKVFTNKKIHISSLISCEGSIEFDNCIIFYNEAMDRKNEIVLEKNSHLTIKNSTVICKGLNIDPQGFINNKNSFIKCGDACEIIFDNNKFVDCSYLLKSNYNCSVASLTMNKCILENCINGFIDVSVYEDRICEISNNNIYLNDVPDYFFEEYKHDHRDWCVININSKSDKTKILFENNTVCQDTKFAQCTPFEKNGGIHCFSSGNAKILNCKFEGLSNPVLCNCVISSEFKNCNGAIRTLTYYHLADIKNCVFEECTDTIRLQGGDISNCKFNSCYGQLIYSDSSSDVNIDYCEFRNIKYGDETSYYLSDKPCIDVDSCDMVFLERNHIRNCLFENIEILNSYLIAVYSKPYDYEETRIYLENNEFRNCITNRPDGKLIKVTASKKTLFHGYEDVRLVQISNCIGLNQK